MHPPARTNPIAQKIMIRMGNFIQEKYYFDMINVLLKEVHLAKILCNMPLIYGISSIAFSLEARV